MRIDEIKEAAIRYLLEKTIITDENDVNDSETLERVHVSRANVLTKLIVGGVRVSPNNFQEFILPYESDIQYSDDYKVFNTPRFINGMIDYVGNSSDNNKITIVTNISDIKDTISKRIPPKTRGVLIGNEFRVYNPNWMSGLNFYALLENPMDSGNYNADLDEYPLDASLMPALFEDMFKTYYQYVVGKKADKINDNVQEW